MYSGYPWLVWYTMYSFISSGEMADSLEAKTWLGLGLGSGLGLGLGFGLGLARGEDLARVKRTDVMGYHASGLGLGLGLARLRATPLGYKTGQGEDRVELGTAHPPG